MFGVFSLPICTCTWILQRLVLVACVGFKRFDSGLLTYIANSTTRSPCMDVIPIAKPHFCTCSTFINICKDGHVLTCKPDTIFLFYFFVATNSTYVSVSVRVCVSIYFFISAE